MRYLYVTSPWLILGRAHRALFPIIAPFKVVLQTVSLFYCLMFRMRNAPEFIIVQVRSQVTFCYVKDHNIDDRTRPVFQHLPSSNSRRSCNTRNL